MAPACDCAMLGSVHLNTSKMLLLCAIQMRTVISGASLVFDRIRLSQAAALQLCNLLCFIIMEVRPGVRHA